MSQGFRSLIHVTAPRQTTLSGQMSSYAKAEDYEEGAFRLNFIWNCEMIRGCVLNAAVRELPSNPNVGVHINMPRLSNIKMLFRTARISSIS